MRPRLKHGPNQDTRLLLELFSFFFYLEERGEGGQVEAAAAAPRDGGSAAKMDEGTKNKGRGVGGGGRMRDRRGCKEGCILIKSQVEPKRATHVGRGLGGGG